jgi:hypothetical protein
MCRQAPSKEGLSLAQVDKFIKQSIENRIKWKKITLFGGEPSLSPNLIKIIKKLNEYLNYSPKTKLLLLTNGWGNVDQRLKNIPENVEIISTKKTGPVSSVHRSVNIAPVDRKEYKNADFRNGCHVLRYGLTLSQFGYYPCSTCFAIDRTMGLNLGQKELPRDNFRSVLHKSCRYCGFFLYSNFRNKPGTMSLTWKKVLKKYKQKRPEMDDF